MSSRSRTRDLLRYLTALTGREPRGGLFEVRYRSFAAAQHPSPDLERPKAEMGRSWHPTSAPIGAVRAILELAEQTDVYVGIAPRRHRHGGKSAIARIWTLWADLDSPENARVSTLPVTPGIIVASGSSGHQHLYWPLTAPLDIASAEQANHTLALALGADDGAVLNAATILRPPSTYNHKSTPPTPVTLLALDRRRRPLGEILEGLPAPPPGLKPQPIPVDRPDRYDDPLQAIAPEHYVEILTGRQVGRSRKISCPLHTERTPSFHVYPTPEQGWSCYGCPRQANGKTLGGDIYTLAAKLWHIEDFPELSRRLYDTFLPGQSPPAPPNRSPRRRHTLV
jgi:hypothetical protein